MCGATNTVRLYLHRTVKKTEDYELRLYDVYPFVNTPYERRDEGYLTLGAYMDGHNSESAKMNTTQPIVMRYEPATVHLPRCNNTACAQDCCNALFACKRLAC